MGQDSEGAGISIKTMRLRYAGTCCGCGAELSAGTTAIYDKVAKTVRCLVCQTSPESAPAPTETPSASPPAPDPVAPGTAGASARREYERRHDKRQAHVRQAHPRIGGLLLALSDDPQSTRAWSVGARGEEELARSFDRLAENGVRALHDRRIPGTRANIDHLAVAPTGVHVVDAKRYVDKRPSLRVEGGLLRPRVEKLMVGSSDRTKLVAGVRWQVETVRAVLDAADLGDVPVNGYLCFVDADWPLLGGTFTIDDIFVLHPRALRDRLTKPGPLDAGRIDHAHRALANSLPVA